MKKKPKLVTRLEKLDRKECTHFETFLQCDLHNSMPELVRLMKGFIQLIKEDQIASTYSEWLIAYMQIDLPGYSKSHLDYQKSQLEDRLDDFIRIFGGPKDPIADQLLITERLIERGETEYAKSSLDKAGKLIRGMPMGLYQQESQLRLANLWMRIEFASGRREARSIFPAILEAVDDCMLSSKLKLLVAMANQEAILHDPSEWDFSRFEIFLHSLELDHADRLRQNSYIRRYYMLLKSFVGLSTEAEIKGEIGEIEDLILGKAVDKFSIAELSDFVKGWLTILRNEEKPSFLEIALHLYLQIIPTALVQKGGKMDPLHLKNAVKLCALLNRIPEGFQLVAEWQGMLPKSYSGGFITFLLCILRLARSSEHLNDKTFVAKSLEILTQQSSDRREDHFLRLEGLLLKIKLFQRLSDDGKDVIIELENAVNTLRTRVHRMKDTISFAFIYRYKQFIQVYTQIQNSQMPNDAGKLENLLIKTRDARYCLERPWLLGLIKNKLQLEVRDHEN